MSKPKAAERPEVALVSWVSVGAKAAPLLTAIHDRKSPLEGRVKRLYLCWRKAPGEEGAKEREALKESIRDLKATLDPICPEILERPWETTAAPIDHGEILPFAEKILREVRESRPDDEIALHLSPGTPAMHAIWLVLGTTEAIPGPLTLIQTVNEQLQKQGRDPVVRVQVRIDTWLRRFRASRPARVEESDTGHVWDPALVQSPALMRVFEQLQDWAPLPVPVLLLGERGTGKTTLANYLRSMSPFQRQGDEWPVAVCGQFRANPQLAQSELFGHAKGAFTDAKEARDGLLATADGDTLFLDEIGDLDEATQRLLMAAVEGRGFRRLGEKRLRNSTFRLVSATNMSLVELRKAGLREDFLDRISTFVVEVPPLRACREDLPQAWRRVLKDAARRLGVAAWEEYAEDPALNEAVLTHPLPGNFRDLQRAAVHLLAALRAGRSREEATRAAVKALGQNLSAATSAPDRGVDLPLDLKAHLTAYEGRILETALERASGNKTEAARLVGLARKTFEHRLRARGGDPR